MKIHITAYDSDGQNPLGVFYYGQWQYPPYPNKVRSYQFKLRMEVMNKFLAEYKKVPYVCEQISFVTEVNLVKYVVDDDINWEAIIKDFDGGKLYNYHADRLQRQLKGVVPEVKTYTGSHHGTAEFLEFTEETAHNWAGPYELDNKKGCLVRTSDGTDRIKFGGYTPIEKLKPINFKRDFWVTDLPHAMYEQHRNTFHKLTKTGVEKLFLSLSLQDKHHVVKEQLNRLKSTYCGDFLSHYSPFEIHLMGNDDSTYSKWFLTKEEMDEELKYLRVMQPLDFMADIHNRGYFFTN